MVPNELTNPTAISFLYELIDKNRQLSIIGLICFLSGFLIFFYLRAIKKVQLFKELKEWEKLIWIVVFGFINFWLSSLIWGLAIFFSILIFVKFNLVNNLEILPEVLFSSLIVSFLVLPAILYHDLVTPILEKFNEGVKLILFAILILTFLIFSLTIKSFSWKQSMVAIFLLFIIAICSYFFRISKE